VDRHIPLKPLLPFLLILFLTVAGYAFTFFYPLSWEGFKGLHLKLKLFEENHPIATPFLFVSLYICYALLSLPGIFILSLLAGFLFVQPFSTLYVTAAATIGASLLFLTVRRALGAIRKTGQGAFLLRIEKGLRENGTSYLLFLRLIPLFPFSIVNLAGAFFGVSFSAFVWTTFIGMIPSVLVYTEAGRGLTLLLNDSDPLHPFHLLNADLFFALAGLALLSLLPIVYKHKRNGIT